MAWNHRRLSILIGVIPKLLPLRIVVVTAGPEKLNVIADSCDAAFWDFQSLVCVAKAGMAASRYKVGGGIR